MMKKYLLNFTFLFLISTSLLLTPILSKKKLKKHRYRESTIKNSNILDLETVSINVQARRPNEQTITTQKTQKRKRVFTQENNPAKDDSPAQKYDHYVFAVQWANSICALKKCPYNTNLGNFFNIHGLWPNSMNPSSKKIQDCKPSSVDWGSTDKALRADLDLHFAGLFGSRQEFNTYEWRKHGTCVNPFAGKIENMSPVIGEIITKWRKLQQMIDLKKNWKRNTRKVVRKPKKKPATDKSEHNLYFKICIDLNKELDLKKKLGDQGIKPSAKKISIKKIQGAINKAFSVQNFHLRCQRGQGAHKLKFFLVEFRFCYDLDFKIMNCKKKFNTNCGDNVFMKK